MKTFLVLFLALTAFFRVSAQVSMELSLDQDEFLPSEPIWLTVKIYNTSSEQLHLGDDPGWLKFSVESKDDFIVEKLNDVPVVEPFDLESSQVAIKHVNLQPYFRMDRAGRYKVNALMYVKAWSKWVDCAPIHFDVIHGAELWSQDFGIVVATNQPPESRKYTLIKANYLRQQLRLYAQVSTTDGGQIFKMEPLGPLVSFSLPEEQVDPSSQLHVLWQTGGQSFSYVVVGADGKVVLRDIYDSFNSRPRLAITPDGVVVVKGGVRRPQPGDLPMVQPPAVPAAAAPVPPAPRKS